MRPARQSGGSTARLARRWSGGLPSPQCTATRRAGRSARRRTRLSASTSWRACSPSPRGRVALRAAPPSPPPSCTRICCCCSRRRCAVRRRGKPSSLPPPSTSARCPQGMWQRTSAAARRRPRAWPTPLPTRRGRRRRTDRRPRSPPPPPPRARSRPRRNGRRCTTRRGAPPCARFSSPCCRGATRYRRARWGTSRPRCSLSAGSPRGARRCSR
mmetsp:Transcript_35983/g.115782  ORF Transcript_35983/g.115782 Transcript_35983/m.115782 type:complete len:214 (-) Transcript_35983:176-817(-)